MIAGDTGVASFALVGRKIRQSSNTHR